LQHALRPLLDPFSDAPPCIGSSCSALSTSMSSVPCRRSPRSLATAFLSIDERSVAAVPFDCQGEEEVLGCWVLGAGAGCWCWVLGAGAGCCGACCRRADYFCRMCFSSIIRRTTEP
jgi:hypothetical protein